MLRTRQAPGARTVLGVGCGVLGIAFVLAAASGAALELQVVAGDGRVVWSVPMLEGEAFDLAFTHSQEHCRWTHHYAAGSGGVEQRASTFVCFGAGMPADAPRGAAIERSARGFTVPAPMTIGELKMMNSDAADISITHRGVPAALGPLLADLEPFTLRIRRGSRAPRPATRF